MRTYIPIDKHVPIPPAKRSKYPLRAMQVGDSFFVRNERGVRRCAREVAKKIKCFRVALRAEGNGFRVWRIR